MTPLIWFPLSQGWSQSQMNFLRLKSLMCFVTMKIVRKPRKSFTRPNLTWRRSLTANKNNSLSVVRKCKRKRRSTPRTSSSNFKSAKNKTNSRKRKKGLLLLRWKNNGCEACKWKSNRRGCRIERRWPRKKTSWSSLSESLRKQKSRRKEKKINFLTTWTRSSSRQTRWSRRSFKDCRGRSSVMLSWLKSTLSFWTRRSGSVK